jgi:PAS domain-containing protein
MDRLDNLTLRTTTALGRLASLQRRADRTPAAASLVRDAIEELSTVLEELRTANDSLTEQANEIAATRLRTEQGRRDFQTLFTAMSTPCLFTDNNGRILDANPSASRLLNVGRQHLLGKSLVLFFVERDPLVAALEAPAQEEFEKRSVVRPRERRPREILVRGVRLPEHDRWCWLLENPTESSGPQPDQQE